jgi:ribosome-associated protein
LSEKLIQTVVKAAEDKKAEKIEIIDVTEKIGLVDSFIILSVNSRAQMRAVMEEIKKNMFLIEGVKLRHIEGDKDSEWVLMDFNDIIVHIFTPQAREYYDLEKFWK